MNKEKVVINGVEVTDIESWNKAVSTFSKLEYQIKEKDKEIERLQNIIKEVRKYIKWHYDLATDENAEFCLLRDRILEILDKEKE